MNKVMIVGGNSQYVTMFKDAGWETVETVEEADLVQFCGGADVSPNLYGEARHPSTFANELQDKCEKLVYEKAKDLGIPMTGICRGGQFLNVMNGGKMHQDVDKHAISHTHLVVDLETGDRFQCTSTHHQAMRQGEGAETVAISPPRSTFKEHMVAGQVHKGALGEVDVEAVFYPPTMSLCFQPHPEFSNAQTTRAYYFLLLARLLGFK